MLRQNRQSGFTIIEAIVATAVFAFVVSASLAVYLLVAQLDSKSRSERVVQQNARFIMDYLAKEIRNGSIDYTYANDQNTLSIINQLDQQELLDWDGNNLTLTKSISGVNATTNLNSRDVKVSSVKFLLSPTINPFDLANDVHIQPHVTVLLTLESTVQKGNEGAKMYLESTFTVRDYPSRQ